MAYHRTGRKFGLKTGPREALVKSLARALVLNGSITTTEAKAKELRPFIEKLVTKARNGSVANRRIVQSRIGDAGATKELFGAIAAAQKTRNGGYTRIIKLPKRMKDGAKMAVIQFVK
ncbi:MAG TPA: 50S ribosomal protein L17 [Candidatus Paceibacterota bacterium]|nr:50S ribosomal protein L17 [Candidatus Paceibacterota bacterium]